MNDYLSKIQTAIIKETNRLGCVVTTRFPMISPNKDLQHGETAIPAGVRTLQMFQNLYDY